MSINFLQTLVLTLFLFVPGARSQDTPAWRETLVQASDDQVWVNIATGVYHYPGTRWYGNTNQGEFMSEVEARAKGYRASKDGQFEA